MTIADTDLLSAALTGYRRQRADIEARIVDLQREMGGRRARASLAGGRAEEPTHHKSGGRRKRRRRMSAAGRARIAAATRKRWAAYRAAKAKAATGATPKKRGRRGKAKAAR